MKDATQSQPEKAEWIIQRCTQQWKGTNLLYEDWPGYSERLMSRTEMLEALKKCDIQWPQHEFRGHNVLNRISRSWVLAYEARDPTT